MNHRSSPREAKDRRRRHDSSNPMGNETLTNVRNCTDNIHISITTTNEAANKPIQ
ncbi:hypothetical protein FRC02_009527 [Tulasnella sp. 418]|nr:hypothetical protein FRC02_009527 [Tulasnella sp. 418]